MTGTAAAGGFGLISIRCVTAAVLALAASLLGCARRARRRSGECAARCRRHRSHRRHRTAKDRRRPHPGLHRARPRRHRAPHRGARARSQQQLGGVRAHQQFRRADRPADRRAALPHGRLRPVLARPRALAHRLHHAQSPATARCGRRTRPPTFSASRSIPAPSSPSSPNCAPTSCRKSICGSRTPTRTRSTPSRLYYGIVIGIAGLLALFLTILFVVKGSVMFPAAAALGWAVLIYIGIDFGFWGKVFDMSAGAERVWRACGEAILSATLLVFLFAYLNLSRWHVRYAHITIAWLAALAALIAVAVFDPAVASGIARMSLAGIAVFGLALVIYLSTHGFDRAVLLIPTWLLLVVWTGGRRTCGDRRRHQRHHRPRAARRPGADRDADRLHGDAARLRRRHHPRHCFGCRAPRTGAHRRRRSDLGLGRLRRQGLHQPGNRTAARPQARHAGRAGGDLARRAASARPRPFPRLARQRGGAAARTPEPGFPAARGRRPLPVVLAQGAPGGRLRRRGGTPGRHAHRRDRFQERRGAAAVRRGARQSHRPAQPRTVHRPHGGRLRLRPLRSADPAVGAGDRSRPLQAGQRFGRHRGRRFHPAHHRAPARPPAQAAGYAGAAVRRPVRADPAVGARAGAHRGVRRDDAAHPARADQLQRPRNLPHRLDRPGARRKPAAPHRGGAQGRRARDVPRQADRRRPHRNLQAGHALAQDRPADAWNRNCAAPSSARRSRCFTSRSCGWRIAPLPASRRWRAGIIPSSAGCRRRNSSTSPRKSA